MGGCDVDIPLIPRAVMPWLTAFKAYSVYLCQCPVSISKEKVPAGEFAQGHFGIPIWTSFPL